MNLQQQERRSARIFLVSMCVFLALILGFPTLANIWFSFNEVTFHNLTGDGFIGFRNYRIALSDPRLWDAVGYSIKFAVICTVFEVGFALLLVFALHPLLLRRPWLTAILMIPMMVSPALMGVMYRLILNEFVGIVPGYLEKLGFTLNFLSLKYIQFTVIAIEVLQWTPFAFLILLTARQSLPYDLEEAAAIDGATGTRFNVLVVLPLIAPAIIIVSFIRFIDSFRVFDHIFVLTGGGPGNSTTSLSIYIYKIFFKQNDLGPAVALSMTLLVATLALLYFGLKLAVRRDPA
ncbi:MAG: sugar ABC transporter permease [Alphaproteobacteria bacterium]|nr:sugar ABC transporter permease [Alphaproteobacteria bacterium]